MVFVTVYVVSVTEGPQLWVNQKCATFSEILESKILGKNIAKMFLATSRKRKNILPQSFSETFVGTVYLHL